VLLEQEECEVRGSLCNSVVGATSGGGKRQLDLSSMPRPSNSASSTLLLCQSSSLPDASDVPQGPTPVSCYQLTVQQEMQDVEACRYNLA
jgi:hypothetical protein